MTHQDDPAENLFREERRSTAQMPLSTLEVIMGYMQAHTADENARIDDVKEDVRLLHAKIDNLTMSINSWMDKTPPKILEQCEVMFDEAIPTAKDNPDATPAEKRKEHRRAHAKWMQNVENELLKWGDLRQKVAEWAVVGALAMIVLAVWQFILKGPK